MTRYLIILGFLFVSLQGQAHQPDISTTMLVEQGDQWLLQVRASLSAFQHEVRTHFEEYKTPEAFEQMVVEHLKNNLSIRIDGKEVSILENAHVQLGHETSVVFELSGVPQNFSEISVKNSSFKDINHNQSALIVLKNGFEKKQFILNEANGHLADLEVEGNSFKARSEAGVSRSGVFSYAAPVGLVALLSLFFLGVGEERRAKEQGFFTKKAPSNGRILDKVCSSSNPG